MVNSEDFTRRLQELMDHYHLNASAFAESIGVQRSAISHILSGRNKPSLEFVMKILDTYPDVELYWLLNGKGEGPFRQEVNSDPDLFTPEKEQKTENSDAEAMHIHPDPADNPPNNPRQRQVVKVVIFYNDNTFEEVSRI